MALFLVLLAALLFSGLLVVLAVAYFAYRHYVVRPAEAARPNASAPAAPSSEGASPNAPAAGDAEPVAAAPPNEAPEASASATSASAASASGVAAAEAASPNVVLTCSPACENLDTISCDGEKVLLVDGGLSLAPGVHECTFAEAGYAARLLSITVKDGERTETTVTLRRRVGVAPEPCGTFINPCE